MPVTIKTVQSKDDLKKFIEFPNILYKDNPYYVPKLYIGELDTLDKQSNPAFDFSEAEYYLAYKNNEIVGRIAAIINYNANKAWNHKEVRYGWFDFIDDKEVSSSLLNTVIEFGKNRGMEKIVGPLGFTDFDPEGMLVEGFDEMCTMVLLYNYEYYPRHLEEMGYTKEIDWLEYKLYLPEEVPEKISKVSRIVKEKYGFKIRKFTKKEIKKEKLGHKIFALINEAYSELYNFTILPEKLIDKYVDFYLGILDLNYVTLVEDSDKNIIAVGITTPSIVKALKKCNGKLFPFGWFHILKSLYFKHEEGVELLLVGVTKEHRNKGVLALIFEDLIPRYQKGGFKYGESNAELETNIQVQAPWDMFEKEQKKRRRIYGKLI